MCSVKNNNGKRDACWNDMEQLKYLIGTIDCMKCPRLPPAKSCVRTLPPRIYEFPIQPKPIEFPCPPPLPPRKTTLTNIPRPCCLRILPAFPPPRIRVPPPDNSCQPHCQSSMFSK